MFSLVHSRCGLPAALVAAAVAFAAAPALAEPGDIIDNSGLIPFDQAFFAFEVESPIGTLKEVPIWDEIERMLDNPYAIALDPSVGGNAQGWPSYRSTQPRRRSFIYRNAAGQPCAPLTPGCNEVPLAGHLVHPLNYNHSTGEELRLLNILFEEADWEVPYQLVLVEAENTDPTKGPLGVPRYEFTYRPIVVTPGEDRIEDDEASPDFNSPIKPDNRDTCILNVDQFFVPGPTPEGSVTVGEGAIICGGDPGEPGYEGFGILLSAAERDEQYSTPALPLPAGSGPGTNLTTGLGGLNRRLYDAARVEPEALATGFIPARDAAGKYGLRKPSLRVAVNGGTPTQPNFLKNSAANLAADPAALVASSENDYLRPSGGPAGGGIPAGRPAAIVLGKALFWDMQVGSDSVQSCGTCHFAAGADGRTKNQLNPNHLGGDLTLQVGDSGPVGDRQANYDLKVSDFPFHRVIDLDGTQGLAGDDPANVLYDTNDVASSMGVFFGRFFDIPAPGAAAFGPAFSGVSSLLPDLRSPNPAQNVDPIPAFQGFRRVEPRNTPTLFASAMNFDNFWDGRARHDFNGGSVQGPSDPQAHVWVNNGTTTGALTPTRQIIRFASLASLATGPALSEFEMSLLGRNWAKIGKKLLQANVTPLANQLVDPMDSVLGPYSNQPGNPSPLGTPAQLAARAAGKPGLCVTYQQLVQAAFHPRLHANTNQHLNGFYTDGDAVLHPNQAPAGSVAIPVLSGGAVVDSAADPFDGFVLSAPVAGAAVAANTNQFRQIEANFALFWGLSIHLWGNILVPDDSPMDRFFDANPDSHVTFGESGEPGIASDLLNCVGENGTGGVPPCFSEVGNFKRDPGVIARIDVTIEGGTGGTLVPSGGTRSLVPNTPDPLLGLDMFLGSNLSLKNPNFRSFRCGECHAGGTLTDHTFEVSHQASFGDRIQEFVTGSPGLESFPEALGRGRIISGFLLEGELQENAQDGIERNIADFELTPGGFPKGQALFDNGVYNIGVTPIANDVSRGGLDAFGWPLSLGYLALKNLGGTDYSPGGDDPLDGFAQPATPGIPLPNFDPDIDPTGGGLYEPTAQDQEINPGFAEEPADPQLPPHLAPWASNIPVGDESNIDELFVGLNTLMAEPMKEGFVDSWGPFNPAAILGESFNNARQAEMATWPNVNRVNVQGSFKAPPLRNVELTGPYFHNGGQLTLRQQLDFYMRGGNFPNANSAHRDFLITNLNIEDEALGGIDPVTDLPEFTEAQKEERRVALIDFLLELTDERVAFERAPFDRPEMIVPLDGAAPENTSGRAGLLAGVAAGQFRQIPAVGAGGRLDRLPSFLNVTTKRLVGELAFPQDAAHGHPDYNSDCDPTLLEAGHYSHYCH